MSGSKSLPSWSLRPPEKASRGWGMVSWGMGVSCELVFSLTG